MQQSAAKVFNVAVPLAAEIEQSRSLPKSSSPALRQSNWPSPSGRWPVVSPRSMHKVWLDGCFTKTLDRVAESGETTTRRNEKEQQLS